MELHFALSERLAQETKELLFPQETGPEAPPERGVIGVVYPSQGLRRTTLLLRRLIQPKAGEVFWAESDGLMFSPAYKSRAATAACARPSAGLMFIHTHPGMKASIHAPSPSRPDLEADRRDLFHLGAALPDGVPLAAGIVGENGRWSVRAYSFTYPTSPAQATSRAFSAKGGRMRRATTVRVVGSRFRKLPTEVSSEADAIDLHAQDSTIRMWGEDGQRILAGLRVGIAGLGGVGGILAEHTARLGVGGAVFVDFDRIHHDNLNRSQGAIREDARQRRLKVDVAIRVAEAAATTPAFGSYAHEASVVEDSTIPVLLDCDIILNAADSPWARQVLDHLAYAHLIPVINGGTRILANPDSRQLVAGKCEVSLAGPGHVCMRCAGTYDLADVTEAQEHPSVRGERAYVEGGDDSVRRAPSVISTNALVAALIQLRLQAFVLGTTPEAVAGTQRYHLTEGQLSWAARDRCEPECPRTKTEALGDAHPLPTGIDLDFRVAREEVADGHPEPRSESVTGLGSTLRRALGGALRRLRRLLGSGIDVHDRGP